MTSSIAPILFVFQSTALLPGLDIVKEHESLPYPEGTACAAVLKAGEKGGDFAKTAFQGLGFAIVYAFLQKVFHVIAEAPEFVTKQTNKYMQ